MPGFYIVGVTISLLFAVGLSAAQDKGKYPAPRFPSYLKPPKNIDGIMPYARAVVRQSGGRTPLGLVEKGSTVLIITDSTAVDFK